MFVGLLWAARGQWGRRSGTLGGHCSDCTALDRTGESQCAPSRKRGRRARVRNGETMRFAFWKLFLAGRGILERLGRGTGARRRDEHCADVV